MKTMKRFMALAIALIMTFALAISASAADITITNASGTYSAYKIFDVEGTKEAIRYKPVSAWTGFYTSRSDVTVADGYVTKESTFDATTFANDALTYAKNNSISVTATNSGTTISLDDGYYVMKSTASEAPYTFTVIGGTLAGVDTTHYSGTTITEKFKLPQIEKKVNSADEVSASIGDTLTYTITLTAAAGTDKYSITDTLPAGLTDATIVSTVYGGSNSVNVGNATVTGGKTIVWSIDGDERAKIADNDTITITYTATLGTNAVISGTGNKNEVVLKYGDDLDTKADATVRTCFLEIVKTNGSKIILPGAEFKLYDAKTGGNEVKVVKVSDGIYRLAVDSEPVAEKIETVNGMVTIQGLANKTYYLEETVAPTGYVKLTTRQDVSIGETNLDAEINGTTYEGGGVQVINNPGQLLPETGGIGTTIFYAVGGVLMVGALALVLLRKRTGAN